MFLNWVSLKHKTRRNITCGYIYPYFMLGTQNVGQQCEQLLPFRQPLPKIDKQMNHTAYFRTVIF